MQMGRGEIEFTMIGARVVDLVDFRESPARLAGAMVRMRLPISSDVPKSGDWVILHAEYAPRSLTVAICRGCL